MQQSTDCYSLEKDFTDPETGTRRPLNPLELKVDQHHLINGKHVTWNDITFTVTKDKITVNFCSHERKKVVDAILKLHSRDLAVHLAVYLAQNQDVHN